ncbi:MAG: AmmeMemoRadiSam system protein A [Candidatus Pacearchaeota archaeon]
MKELINLARETIKCRFRGDELRISNEIKKKYSKKAACFVTLTKNGELRGCIGSLKARQPLYQDVIENSLNAAFNDPRFIPLQEHELKDIKIEISVLSDIKKIEFTNEKDLLKKINKNMGIVLRKGFNYATFLPQVWEEINDKVKFLEYLSLKAGLDKDDWKKSEIGFYTVDKVKEE